MAKLIVANWKMNPASLAEALALAKACDYEGVVLCVPFPYLIPLQHILQHAVLGAQDVAHEERGAYTGQVSASMLKDAGCEYVIVGHSERRRDCGETDALVQQKLDAALTTGLIPILCVSDPQQVSATKVPLIVYEPEEAISTLGGSVTSLHTITASCRRIHSIAPSAMVLYGGSVTSKNVKEILALPCVDGVLVGAASLDAQEFQNILQYA